MARTAKVKMDPAADPEKVLAQKSANAERLIRDKDKIIERELQHYDWVALHMRLRDECFNLYPMMLRLLLHMIEKSDERLVFSRIVDGVDIRKIAQSLHRTPEEVGKLFRHTVKMLGLQIEPIAEIISDYDELRQKHKVLSRRLSTATETNGELKRKNSYLRNHVWLLKTCYRSQKEELKQKGEEIDGLKTEKGRLEARLEELTHIGPGLWGKLRWLWGR